MGTFKVGDRIVAKMDSLYSVRKGDIFTVIEVFDKDYIRFMNDAGETDGWHSEYFDLVPANPAIVCLIENGQPLPSVRPHIHADVCSASMEAARLSGIYKGQKFGVYVLTHTVSEDRTYAHEWQRLAANGEKLAAIDELRAISGLDLDSAKRAVTRFAA